QLVTGIHPSNDDRLEHADLADRVRQPLERVLVEPHPRLPRVRLDRPDRDLEQPGLLRRAGNQRGQPSSQSASSHSSPPRRNSRNRFRVASSSGASDGSSRVCRGAGVITDGRSSSTAGTGSPSGTFAATSPANARYVVAPFDPGSYTVIGWPYPGASDSRTVRGMTVS